MMGLTTVTNITMQVIKFFKLVVSLNKSLQHDQNERHKTRAIDLNYNDSNSPISSDFHTSTRHPLRLRISSSQSKQKEENSSN